MTGYFKRLLHAAYAALQAGGAMHVAGPWIPPWPPHPPDGPRAERPERLDAPPPAHPERLCPGAALTPAERALDRELEGGP